MPMTPITRHYFTAGRMAASIVLAIIIVGSALWGISAWRYNHVIDGWIKSQRSDGYDLQFDRRKLNGYPLRVMITFDNLRWKSNNAILFHAEHMTLMSKPLQWNVFDAKFKDLVEIAAPIADDGRALVMSGREGHAHIELDDNGVWRVSRVDLLAAQLGPAPKYLFNARKLSASLERPAHMPKDHTETGLTIIAEADDLVLPPSIPTPFGDKMVKFAVDMRVMDVMPDYRKRESVAAWNQNSGVVEFDKLNILWGPMSLAAKGTMGFDDDLQPEGAFAGTLGGQDDVLKRLTEDGFIPQRQEAMLQSAMKQFAKSGKEGASSVELPITVQLGGLFLGPIKIFSFPQISWPTAVPGSPGVPVSTPMPDVAAP